MGNYDLVSSGDSRDRGLIRELRALNSLPASALAARIEEALDTTTVSLKSRTRSR